MSDVVDRAGGLYALEWSHQQKAFHIETLASVIQKNLETATGDIDPGYIVVGLFETHMDASEGIGLLREKFPDTFTAAPSPYEELSVDATS